MAGDNREYELKFRAGPDALACAKSAFDSIDPDGRWSVSHLRSRYFDTASRRLGSKGVSLRVRQSDGKSVQTVKAAAGGAGGIMDRWEWECPIDGIEPDFSRLPLEAREALGGVKLADLAPIIDVAVERQTKVVRRRDPLGPTLVAEAVLDTGTVSAGGRTEGLSEVELELGQGRVRSFFQLAADFIAACPMPVSSTTKAARGYRLLAGTEPGPSKLAKFDMAGDLTVDDALTKIFSGCIGNITANEQACLDGTDPEGVHQMRVSIRKMRSALKTFKHYIDPLQRQWLADDLKWMGSQLGPARDWDVFLDETLVSMAAHGIDVGAVAALEREGRRKRAEAYEHVRAMLGGARYAQVMLRLTAFAALQSWRPDPATRGPGKDPLATPLRKAARRILNRPYRKLLKAGDGMAGLDMEARHRVRIRIKQLRYAVDFLRGVHSISETEAFGAALRHLQDNFGHLNDVVMALRLTDELIDPARGPVDEAVRLAVGEVRGWNARALRDIEPQLIVDWGAFCETAPYWRK